MPRPVQLTPGHVNRNAGSPSMRRRRSPELEGDPPSHQDSGLETKSRSGRVVKPKIYKDGFVALLDGRNGLDVDQLPPAADGRDPPLRPTTYAHFEDFDEDISDVSEGSYGSTRTRPGRGSSLPRSDSLPRPPRRPAVPRPPRPAPTGYGGGGVFKQAAIEILRAEKRLMSTGEIARLALRRGLVRCSGKTPEATMASALYTDIKRKEAYSLFVRPREGLFGLREWIEEGFITANVIAALPTNNNFNSNHNTGASGERNTCYSNPYNNNNNNMKGNDHLDDETNEEDELSDVGGDRLMELLCAAEHINKNNDNKMKNQDDEMEKIQSFENYSSKHMVGSLLVTPQQDRLAPPTSQPPKGEAPSEQDDDENGMKMCDYVQEQSKQAQQQQHDHHHQHSFAVVSPTIGDDVKHEASQALGRGVRCLDLARHHLHQQCTAAGIPVSIFHAVEAALSQADQAFQVLMMRMASHFPSSCSIQQEQQQQEEEQQQQQLMPPPVKTVISNTTTTTNTNTATKNNKAQQQQQCDASHVPPAATPALTQGPVAAPTPMAAEESRKWPGHQHPFSESTRSMVPVHHHTSSKSLVPLGKRDGSGEKAATSNEENAIVNAADHNPAAMVTDTAACMMRLPLQPTPTTVPTVVV